MAARRHQGSSSRSAARARRLAVAAASVLLAAGLTGAAPPLPGPGAPLAVSPDVGDPSGPWTWALPDDCAAPADSVRTVVSGPGVGGDGGVVVGEAVPAPPGGQPVDPGATLLDVLGAATGVTPPAADRYVVEVQCLATGTDGVVSPTGQAWRAGVDLVSASLFRVVDAQAPRDTTVLVLTVDPPSAVPGEPMTLTATVLPLGGGAPTGSVRFTLEPSGTSLEAPVADGGTATVSTPAPGPGDHVVRAEYGGDDAHEPSAEEVEFTTIDPEAPLTTVTTVTVGGGPVPDVPLDVVADITAPGSSVTPVGTCDVRQGEVLLATRLPVDPAGQCRYRTSSLPGSGDLVVAFVPGGPFLASVSDPVTVSSSLTAPADGDGLLVLSTPFASGPVGFGTALLDPVAASWRSVMSLRADGGVGGIRIEDRRPGSNTFSLTLSVSPPPGLEPEETLPGSALSFRDTVARYVPGDRLDGSTPETTVETFDILGLSEVPQVAARGIGPGEVLVEGDLLVSLPTSVAPGTYTTTIVVTLVGGDPPPPEGTL